MKNKLPLVSIVVPSYNHCNYIEKCIESIISQNYKNYELIVIDDGSSDNSKEILLRLQKHYEFQLVLNENQGLAKTLNFGFKEIARGKYFTFCASDDFWLPNKLDLQVELLEKNLNYGMVYGKAKIIDENNNYLEKNTETVNRKLKGGNIFKELILGDFHPPVNYMLRGDVIRDLGYYREDIWAEDFDMNLRIANQYPIGFIEEYLSGYRTNLSIPSKNLTFKTIYSHKDSIDQFKDSKHYNQALKAWHFKCFNWYAPFKVGKKLAIKGMVQNLDKIFKKSFWHACALLLFRWY
jgi:glycosyltransferase involved in cell wall biosynthesis